MTAYVYQTIATSYGRLTIEVQSLNRKHLEVTTILGTEFARYEVEIKKSIGNLIQRGKITLKLFLLSDDKSLIKIRPNIPLAKEVKNAWEEIGSELALPEKTFNLSFLHGLENLFLYEDTVAQESAFKNEFFSHVNVALNSLIDMKREEGHFLYQDIKSRIHLIQSWIDEISLRTPHEVDAYRNKLIERLEFLVPGSVQNDERVLREVALFAERADITEELIRLKCHIAQFLKSIENTNESIGKKLEFFMVEMVREANTIGSKTTNTEISHYVVDIKSEIEKIKEQLQNIE